MEHLINSEGNTEGNAGTLESYSTNELVNEIYRRNNPVLPEPVCSHCRIALADTDYEYLTDVRVIVSEGEEGYADVTQWLCERCLEMKLYTLRNIGFVDHRHGGINYLEANGCGGWNVCTEPTSYGRVYIGNSAYNEGT